MYEDGRGWDNDPSLASPLALVEGKVQARARPWHGLRRHAEPILWRGDEPVAVVRRRLRLAGSGDHERVQRDVPQGKEDRHV